MGGVGGGGGSKLHGYFFQADFIHVIHLFLFVCFFCFCFVLEHSFIFSLSTGSQLIEISIEDTGDPPPPWIIDYFLRGRGD